MDLGTTRRCGAQFSRRLHFHEPEVGRLGGELKQENGVSDHFRWSGLPQRILCLQEAFDAGNTRRSHGGSGPTRTRVIKVVGVRQGGLLEVDQRRYRLGRFAARKELRHAL